MLNSTCACPVALDRCDRCDLLLGLPGLHLISVDRARTGFLLEVESCDPVAGCPGCGVIAAGHGRIVTSMIDAPWRPRSLTTDNNGVPVENGSVRQCLSR